MEAKIEGPVAGGKHGRPWGAPLLDLQSVGYLEEEWFLTGEAVTYELVDGTDATVDGRWSAEPTGSIPYRTRVVIRRPIDISQFNGTVVVSWNNVSAGFEILQWEGPETFAGGFLTVGVSAQRVGLNGYKADPRGLLAWDPERYESLSIPSDAASYDIFADAIRSVAPEKGHPLLPGYEVKHVIATGASQSASRLHTYLNAVHPHVGLVTGYIFDVYAGNGAPVSRASTAGLAPYPPARLRDDTGARILLTNSETEALRFAPLRRADDERYVYWETAGMAHGGASGLVTAAKNERDWGFPLGAPVELPEDIVPNELDKQPVEDGSLHWMHRWLTEGTPPPSIPPIEVAGEPLEIRRDAHGIALGGLRLPQVEVPTATVSGVNDGPPLAQLVGSLTPFAPEKLRSLYPDHDTYCARFGEAAEAAMSAGWLLRRDGEAMIRQAEQSPVP